MLRLFLLLLYSACFIHLPFVFSFPVYACMGLRVVESDRKGTGFPREQTGTLLL